MGSFIVVAFISALLAASAWGGASTAYAAENDLTTGITASTLSAQANYTPQASSKGSKYGLLAKNGQVYPCDKRGKKLADTWDSRSSNGVSGITKLFVAANAKKVPSNVKYRMQYRALGTITYQAALNSLTGNAKSVKFLTKKGANACKTIEANAFSNSKKLKTLDNFNKTKVGTIEQFAFYSTGLKKISVPKTLKTIGDSAFSGCDSLTAVKGLNKTKVRKTGSWAFNQCALKSISLPKTCKSIGSRTFNQCRNLKSVSIGKKVSLVDAGAFYGCRALKKVVLPASVAELGSNAFGDCVNLQSLTMKSTSMVISTLSKSAFMTDVVFDTKIADPGERAYIYVPKSLLAKYQVAIPTNPWYQYASKFRAI